MLNAAVLEEQAVTLMAGVTEMCVRLWSRTGVMEQGEISHISGGRRDAEETLYGCCHRAAAAPPLVG